ncbi:MAG: hypothetical protein R3C01_12815 [Planctomycetaceae bacterium]
METVTCNVRDLGSNERTAVEQLVGHALRENEQLIIQVVSMDLQGRQQDDPRPVQTLDNWAGIYEGLTDEQIDEIDKVINTRAYLTRNLP